MKTLNFKDIIKYTKKGSYEIHLDWDSISDYIERKTTNLKLDINPDFQRGHVWTFDQCVAYVEYKLSGGPDAEILYFNCVGWMHDYRGPFVLVDGLQRLNAVRLFLDNKNRAFGHYYSEFTGPLQCQFKFNINNLKSRAEVLNWYIQMNSTGIPHTDKEISRVKELLQKEK
jgi:uncharacterized protein with ParB-like and HNH nuclease domain